MCNCSDTEVWKAVPDWPDYEVSDHGNVRSHKGGHVHPLKPLANPDRGNYLHFCTHTNGMGRRTIKIHVMVARLFQGERPEGLVIRHLDGNPQNNHATNLKYGTHQENEDDKGAARYACSREVALLPKRARLHARQRLLQQRHAVLQGVQSSSVRRKC